MDASLASSPEVSSVNFTDAENYNPQFSEPDQVPYSPASPLPNKNDLVNTLKSKLCGALTFQLLEMLNSGSTEEVLM